MTDQQKNQLTLERQLADLPSIEEEQETTLKDLYGPMEDWIFELVNQRLFLNPAARQWMYFDRVHQTWEPTGFGPGEVEFAVFEDHLGVRLPQEKNLAAAPTILRRQVKYWLEIESPDFPDPIVLDGDLVIGRGSDSDIVVTDKLASRQHAKFSSHGGGLTIEDLGTTNGTYVNDIEIDAPVSLSEGDLISIGDLQMKVSTTGS